MLESNQSPVLSWVLKGTRVISALQSLSFPSLHMGAIPLAIPEAIRRKVELEWGTEDEEYLDKVRRNLEKALQEHPADVVVYNAGTDILEGDRLGGLSISPQVCPDSGGRVGSALGTQPQERWAQQSSSCCQGGWAGTAPVRAGRDPQQDF